MGDYDYIRSNKGHQWKLDEFGDVDIFAYDNGQYCNGPVCVKCGYAFCHHCIECADIEPCSFGNLAETNHE